MLASASDRSARSGAGGGRSPGSRTPTRAELALAAGLARGEEAAFASFQREYSGVLRGYLRHALRDGSGAEDVLQQVMLELWQRRSSFDPSRSSLISWAMLIARSRAIDHMRRRVPEPHDPHVTASLVDRAAVQDSRADELLEQWRLAHLLTQLPHEESRILRMRFHEELSQSEIAAATGIPLGTVKTRMVSALARLRELIDGEG